MKHDQKRQTNQQEGGYGNHETYSKFGGEKCSCS